METAKEQVNGMGRKQRVIKGENYHISFAEVDTDGPFGGDESTETAIVTKDSFYILNGDHTDAYEKCNSLEECMAYFNANVEQRSSWSD